jgi:acyl dehydratase
MQNDGTKPRGLYFEQFEVGMTFITAGRTVTEADVVSFAGLSGDYTSIHTDAEYAQTTVFGQRVAHGLLGLSIISGLAVRSGFVEGTVLAFREIKSWKFSRPVFLGDTIHAEIMVESTKALPRLGGGALDLEVKVKNQNDEIVMKGAFNFLVQSDSAGEQNPT